MMKRQFKKGKPRWLHPDMSWDDRLYFLHDSWRGFCFRWRHFIGRHMIMPLCHSICGRHACIINLMYHLDDLEDSTMYGTLCYKFPEHIPVEDRIKVAHMTLDWVRGYIKYNFLGEDWGKGDAISPKEQVLYDQWRQDNPKPTLTAGQ